MYIDMYICILICMCMYIYIYTIIYVYASICIYTYVYPAKKRFLPSKTEAKKRFFLPKMENPEENGQRHDDLT